MRLKYLSIFLLFIFGCQNANLEDVEEITNEEVFPAEKAAHVTYVYSDSALIKAVLKTPYMEKYLVEDPYIEMPKGMEVTFFNSYGDEQSYLKANYGIRYTESKLTECEGNVVVVNIEGDTLMTEHLIWDEKKDKVYSEKFVRVRTEDEIINSEGMETDPDFSEYKFKNIKGIINLEDNEIDEE